MAALPVVGGRYIFVNSSNNGSGANAGTRPEAALSTFAQAVSLCTANNDDCIVLMPGHAETVTATNMALSVAGVTVVGLGKGLKRPTFTFGAAAATITVSAANCSFSNIHCIGNFLNVVTAFTLTTAKDCQIDNCTFVDSSASLNFLCIVTTNATANASDGLTFTNNFVWGLATTDGAVISVLGALDRLRANDNHVDKAATNDAGHFMTQAALVCRAAQVKRNTLNVVGATNAAVGVFATGSSTTNTGVFAYNLTTSLDTTTAVWITATLNYAVHENYMSGVVAASGTLYPAADNPA